MFVSDLADIFRNLQRPLTLINDEFPLEYRDKWTDEPVFIQFFPSDRNAPYKKLRQNNIQVLVVSNGALNRQTDRPFILINGSNQIRQHSTRAHFNQHITFF